MFSVYLMVMGLLLGYLAEQQKHLRAEKAVVTGILSRMQVEAGLTGTIEQIFTNWFRCMGGHAVVVVAQESHSERVFVGELNEAKLNGVETGLPSELRWLESASGDAKSYLEDFPGDACYAAVEGGQWKTLALDGRGSPVAAGNLTSMSPLRDVQTFHSLVTVAFLFGSEWRGRVFLFNPSWRGEKQEELRFLQDLVREVGSGGV